MLFAVVRIGMASRWTVSFVGATPRLCSHGRDTGGRGIQRWMDTVHRIV